MELAPVPRCDTAFAVLAQAGRRYVVATENRVRPIGETVQRFETGNSIGDAVQVDRRMVAGAVIL
jgi:hypothetical protein